MISQEFTGIATASSEHLSPLDLEPTHTVKDSVCASAEERVHKDGKGPK